MQDYFKLETIPGTKEKLRVYWEDGESIGESDHRPWDSEAYVMNGIGEDGSVWEQFGDYHSNADEFYEHGDPEMIEKPGTSKLLSYYSIHDKNPGYWNMDGRMPGHSYIPNQKPNGYKVMPIEEYFKLRVGDYPNVNIKKGPDAIAYNNALSKDPRRFHQSIVGNLQPIDWKKILVDEKKGSSKKYTYDWNEEKQADIITATTYGILHDVLSSHKINIKNRDVAKGILKYLL